MRRQAQGKGQDVNFDELLTMEPDSGTTNIRNTTSHSSVVTRQSMDSSPTNFAGHQGSLFK
jgi:hypothetical protein